MIRVIFAVLLLATAAAAEEKPTPPSAPYIICAAYADALTKVYTAKGLDKEAAEMTAIGTKFGAFAYSLDELEKLPGTATLDLVRQLREKFIIQTTRDGALELMMKYQPQCLLLANKAGSLEEWLNRKR